MGKTTTVAILAGHLPATPLSAGIAALVLSANPLLTWVEAREIMRHTAIKLDLSNADPNGQWLDENGAPSRLSGKPSVFSQWYGYGRLDARAAVAAALAYDFPRDLMIRNTLLDDGENPVASTSDSPDIWVRTTAPASDPDAVPVGYDEAGPHQMPTAGTNCWIYARIRNRGTQASLDAWVRFYIAAFTGTPFEHPRDWEPRNGLGNTTPGTWQPSTYLIGEVGLPSLDPGTHIVVDIPWLADLIPPEQTPSGDPWNPRLLVEVTPHDGPLTGSVIDENNNLAEKAITIVYPS